MSRPYRRYRGVAIRRTATPLPGSTFHEDGRPRRPKKDEIDVTYAYPNGYPCDTLKEAQQMVDNVFTASQEQGVDDATIVKVMNSDED